LSSACLSSLGGERERERERETEMAREKERRKSGKKELVVVRKEKKENTTLYSE
jgi:hypothetical protein